jgi:hypothetical protein
MKIFVSLLLSVFSIGTLSAQDLTLEMKDLGRDQINYAGFSLNTNKTLKIEALGAGADRWVKKIQNFQQDEYNLFAYAWILNSETREMVWRMTVDNTENERWSEWNRKFDGEVKLDKGDYELYFSAIEPDYFSFNGGFLSFDKIVKKIFGDEDWWEDHSADWKIKVQGVDEIFQSEDVKKFQRKMKDSGIVDLTSIRDGRTENRGFSLSKPALVEIYCIGEGYKGKMYDTGWILNADTHDKVWEMSEQQSEPAGGAVKNRETRETIKLDKGDYLVYYKTDDNHSTEKWNANPPYDPFYWGITVKMANKNYDPSIISKYTTKKQDAIISIQRVGDYAYKEEGLKVDKPSKIRIYSIGEGRGGDMFDYGWISEANTGRIVWKMRYRDTRHAGGNSKNRMVDEVITLEPGEYIVHYQTDDSHSYEEWNAPAPQDPEFWGITIYPVGENEAVSRLKKSEIKGNEILAQLTRIGDDEHVRKQFSLNRTTRIRIKCLGEGSWDEMYDYGWIENTNTHRTVWRMEYRKTEHAGGAEKNRMIDTIITLEPGTYMVNYKSDDSHSFYDWNDDEPRDPESWGITVYRLDN